MICQKSSTSHLQRAKISSDNFWDKPDLGAARKQGLVFVQQLTTPNSTPMLSLTLSRGPFPRNNVLPK